MALSVVARFKFSNGYEESLKELAQYHKTYGATSVTGGRCSAGSHSDLVVVMTYPNFEAYGKDRDSCRADPVYMEIHRRFQDRFPFIKRSLITSDEF